MTEGGAFTDSTCLINANFITSEARASASWNWCAFFFPGYWCCYRKMYGWGILCLAASLMKMVIPFIGLAVAVAMGILGNKLYYKKAEKSVLSAARLTPNVRKNYLQNVGGRSAAVVIGAILIILFLFAYLGGFYYYY